MLGESLSCLYSMCAFLRFSNVFRLIPRVNKNMPLSCSFILFSHAIRIFAVSRRTEYLKPHC